MLVLNDCPGTLALLAQALMDGGFRVRGATVTSFRDGESLQGSFDPDVIVYDIGRGGDDDWDCLRRLTELPAVAGKPLVITTTNVVKVDGQRDAVYMRSRLQFLSAPYDLSDLVARVGDAIGLAPLAARISGPARTREASAVEDGPYDDAF